MTDKISTVLESLAQFQAERDEYRARAEAAEAEIERLRAQVAAIAQWAGASDETELMSWVDSGQDGG